MKKKYHIMLAFLCVITLFGTNNVYAQKEKLTTVESVVVNEDGNPVVNARVFAGKALTQTDENGKFTFQIEPEDKIIIEAEGYESTSLAIGEVTNRTKIDLKKSKFKYETNDKVNLGFRQAYKGDVVGAVSSLNTTEINKYDNQIFIDDILTGRTLGVLGSNNIRGVGIGLNVADITGSGLSSGNALFIVDGLPRDISSMRMTEIESVTVLKDANAVAMYGSAAINGVILLTTKRGEAFKSKSDISYNYGILTPRAMPNFLNSADYMTYYNQARINDGLTPQFTNETIENHRSGNKYRYPNVDYYSDEYLNNSKNYFDLLSEFSGGNDIAKFYANMGWYSAGSIIHFGEAADARNNVFNVRGNVDLKINNWIKTSIDGASTFGSDKSQRGNYWGSAVGNRPYEFTPLIPFDLIDPNNSLLTGRKNDIDGKYLLGGNTTFQTNAIADAYSAGIFERISRKFSFNNRIDFDLDNVTKGLSFHSNISFDYYTRYDQTVANTYSVYTPTWAVDKDSITELTQLGTDTRPGTQVVGNVTFNRRIGFYGLFSYDRVFNNDHHVTGSLLGYGTTLKEQGDFQGVRNVHMGLQLNYSYANKYMIDFSSAYVNSVKLPAGNKGGFSPTLGLAWVLSEEDFMSSSKNIDWLKLRLTGGILNSDIPIGGFYYYDNRYGTSGSYGWNEGVRSRSGVASSWAGNPNLGFAKRNNINFGLEGLFFKKTIGIEANLFYDVYSDMIVRETNAFPSFYTDFVPYDNFGEENYKGAELAVSFNKSVGKWNFYSKVNMLYVTSERVKVDEIYTNDYQYRQGRPVDATFGLEAIGFFESQEDINNSAAQYFGTVKPGDIKYKDQNGDGVVDSNDEVYLRRYQAPLSGGLELKISYSDFTLFVLGEGRSGSDNFKESNYYWVDGNKKYSEVVTGAWTPETATTATYPRLSSTANSNNNRRSSYWMYNNDYFQIRKIQLSWNMPETVTKSLLMKNLNLFVDASDVYQFAKNQKIRELNTTGEPYYRTFSIGVKANF